MRYILLAMFGVMLASEIFSIELSLAPGLSVKNAFVYLIVISLIVQAAARHDFRIEAPIVLSSFTAYVLYGTMSWLIMAFIVEPSQYSTLATAISLKSKLWDHFLFLLVFLYGVKESSDARWLLSGTLWLILLANFVAFIDILNLPDLGLILEREDGRVSGPMGESNQYGAFMCFNIPLVIALYFRLQSGLWRFVTLVGIVTSLILVVSTASRGAFVGLFVSGIAGSWVLHNYLSRRVVGKLAAAGLILGALVVAFVFVLGYADLLYDRVIGQSTGVNASSGRMEVWSKALQTMFSMPWSLVTGFGWQAYETSRAFFISTHNTYLNVFYNLGLLGLGLFMTVLVGTIRYVKLQIENASSTDKALYIGFMYGTIAFLVAIFFVDIHKPWFFIWSTVGITLRIAANSVTFGQTDRSGSSIARPGPVTSMAQ